MVHSNKAKSFTPEKDIPDLSGKVIVITGGNRGLGKETILQLSKHNPAHIYLLARSAEKGLGAIKDIQIAVPSANITFIQCDLASLPSVAKAAEEFTLKSQRLNILILNAGVLALPPGVTEQGYEIQFGTNHVGHALLTKWLMPTLLKTAEGGKDADVRVISISSHAHTFAPSSGIIFPKLKTNMASALTATRYTQSKLANILFANELAKRYPSITSVSLHPGVVATNLYEAFEKNPIMRGVNKVAKKVFYVTTEVGARGQIWAAVAPLDVEIVSGEYYTPIGVTGEGSKLSRDTQLAKKLWEWTEKELEDYPIA